MARPIRKRKLGYIPQNHYFCPDIFCDDGCQEVVISHEELESIRLSDYENLEQTKASIKMEVSRGTYQRILVSAHKKVADALVNGRAIKVEGGNYVLNDCIAHCISCNETFIAQCNVLFDEYKGMCPECGSFEIECSNPQGECILGSKRHQAIKGCTRGHKHNINQLLSNDEKNARIQLILDKMEDSKKAEFLINCKKKLQTELLDIKKLIEIYKLD